MRGKPQTSQEISPLAGNVIPSAAEGSVEMTWVSPSRCRNCDLAQQVQLPSRLPYISPLRFPKKKSSSCCASRSSDCWPHQREWLFGKLYRLDVREVDIQRVLAEASSEQNKVQAQTIEPALGLARLIYERHRERMATRNSTQPYPEDQDPELGDLSW